MGVPAESVTVPVIGGHAGETILPLLSQASHNILRKLSVEEAAALTVRIQNAGTEVVDAKAGAGSATLSMAYAAYVFTTSCMQAMNGHAGIVECTYIDSDVVKGCDFFAQRVKLGRNGVCYKYGLGSLNATEQAALATMTPQLAAEIKKGLDFAPKPPAAPVVAPAV